MVAPVKPLTERGVALARTPLVKQGGRFIAAGLANTAVTYITIFVVRNHGATVGVASASGYILGMIQGFVLSRFWTFAGIDHVTPAALQVAGFVVVNLICGAIFTQSNVVLSHHLPLIVASVASTAIITPLSFALNRWGVFRARRQK